MDKVLLGVDVGLLKAAATMISGMVKGLIRLDCAELYLLSKQTTEIEPLLSLLSTRPLGSGAVYTNV